MNTILFDLDGTLLPMDQDRFAELYFGALSSFAAAAMGADPKAFIGGLREGTKAMLKNDGGDTNRARFWERFCAVMGEPARMETLEPVFERFYETEFRAARGATAPSDDARRCIALLKQKGYTLALATNPLFPPAAVEMRLSWAGLSYADFAHVTTYDNSRFCKPAPAYFTAVLEALNKSPEACLMVGNDASDDLAAREAGLDVYLVTDCLINEKNLSLADVKQGSMKDFYAYAEALPEVR